MNNNTSIAVQLAQLHVRIQAAENAAGRPPGSTRLLAVTKGQPLESITGVIHAGIRDLGENYVQEALPKMQALAHMPLTWHFIGRLQQNKISTIARHFSWVHSVTQLRQAEQLHTSNQNNEPLNICIQVNTSGEISKGGATFEELNTLAAHIQKLSRIKLRGLMTIPAPLSQDNPAATQAAYQALAAAFAQLNQQGHQLDTLSMGMSSDFELAIAAGATLIRVGTLLFGPRVG